MVRYGVVGGSGTGLSASPTPAVKTRSNRCGAIGTRQSFWERVGLTKVRDHSWSELRSAGSANTVGSVSYQVKPRSHVVSAGYLRAWTNGGKIALRLGASEEAVTTSVRNVGVRRNFYRRERPKTSETIYDTEWLIE